MGEAAFAPPRGYLRFLGGRWGAAAIAAAGWRRVFEGCVSGDGLFVEGVEFESVPILQRCIVSFEYRFVSIVYVIIKQQR